MINYIFVILGICLSALAQLCLKKASVFEAKTIMFFLFFALAGLCYVFSFGVYSYLLKSFPISKISPIMTLGTMMFVIFSGVIFFKEEITLRCVLGIIFGIIAVLLLSE